MDTNASRFSMLSPLDHRYYFANKKLYDQLSLYLSEEATIHYIIKIEIALLKALGPHCNIPESLISSAQKKTKNISLSEILEEETRTHHNILAIVNVIKKHVSPTIAPFVHLGATSYDISDTATSLRIKDVTNKVVIPLLIELEETIIHIAEKYIDTPQVGRTHGQFAVPITVGHTFAEYVSRLGSSIKEIHKLSHSLTGKLSGAVGGYNALSLIVKDPIELERIHLASLGLLPSTYSNQISEPEPVLRLLLEMNIAFGIIANLADDLRNLQRSEIAECSEFFDEKTQGGSSTMPHKRNPWNSEHIKSLYKVFSPRVLTFFSDQISEHQRDLTNSASQRFIAEYIVGFASAANRACKVMKNLTIHTQQIHKNLTHASNKILIEAAYILLALSGNPHAYKIMKNNSAAILKSNKTIIEILQDDAKVWHAIHTQLRKRGYESAETFFSTPTHYMGKTILRSKRIIATQKKSISKIKEACVAYV